MNYWKLDFVGFSMCVKSEANSYNETDILDAVVNQGHIDSDESNLCFNVELIDDDPYEMKHWEKLAININ